MVASTSAAYRLIEQGAVRVDGERVSDAKLVITVDSEHVYQVGKREFMRIAVQRAP